MSELKICTRTEGKKLICNGRLTCNGTVLSRPEEKLDPETDCICLDGRVLVYEPYEYYMFHKPAGCVSATKDNIHKTVCDYIETSHPVFPVGRLDIDTEGLLLITDDGTLAHNLLSPSKHIEKTYYAQVNGLLTDADMTALSNGIFYGEEKISKPGVLEILTAGDSSACRLTITEGKFHQVKRMFSALGKEVTYLKRIKMGALYLDPELKPGEYRKLTPEELELLTH